MDIPVQNFTSFPAPLYRRTFKSGADSFVINRIVSLEYGHSDYKYISQNNELIALIFLIDNSSKDYILRIYAPQLTSIQIKCVIEKIIYFYGVARMNTVFYENIDPRKIHTLVGKGSTVFSNTDIIKPHCTSFPRSKFCVAGPKGKLP
tara:strand:- start:1112 stop:1555 length:444 start_codon:yes stop_codon:yes gene_type:complete